MPKVSAGLGRVDQTGGIGRLRGRGGHRLSNHDEGKAVTGTLESGVDGGGLLTELKTTACQWWMLKGKKQHGDQVQTH